LTISPDGQWLYFGSGSRTDHGEKQGSQREVPLTSAIFRVPVDAHDLMLQNDATVLQPYLYADGFRNPFEMEFNGEAELFAIDNGPDIDLPDEINWVREGNSYGFPWRFGAEANPVLQSDYRGTGDQRLHAGYQAFDLGTYKYDSTFPAAPANVQLVDPILNHGPDGDHFRSGPDSDVLDASQMGQTLAGVTAHRSPLGLAFDTAGSLCGEYKGAGFALSFGAVQDVMGDPGGDLLMLQMSKVSGAYEMHATQLVAGFLGPVDSLLIGNKLYVIEFTGDAGNIYEISLPETVAPTFR
jgi:glucose/arabinose dehydrogenase